MKFSKDFRNILIIISVSLISTFLFKFLLSSDVFGNLHWIGGVIMLMYWMLSALIVFIISLVVIKTNKLFVAIVASIGTTILSIGIVLYQF